MYARVRGGVFDHVSTPVIENPCFSYPHVYLLVAAMKTNFGKSDDGNVNSDSGKPVIVDVAVWGHYALARQQHEPRTTENRLESRQNLLDIGTAIKEWRRQHGTTHIVIGTAVGRNETYRRVALESGRMRAPVLR